MDRLSDRAYMTLVGIAAALGFVSFFGGVLYVGLCMLAVAGAGA